MWVAEGREHCAESHFCSFHKKGHTQERKRTVIRHGLTHYRFEGARPHRPHWLSPLRKAEEGQKMSQVTLMFP